MVVKDAVMATVSNWGLSQHFMCSSIPILSADVKLGLSDFCEFFGVVDLQPILRDLLGADLFSGDVIATLGPEGDAALEVPSEHGVEVHGEVEVIRGGVHVFHYTYISTRCQA